MRVFGAHVPFSGWTVAALISGAVVSLVLWRPLARARRWRPGATLAVLLSLTVALALTVTPEGSGAPIGLRACLPDDLPDLAFNVLHTGGGPVAALLNFLLMLPLTTSLVLAGHRVRLAVAAAVLLPPAIELTQAVVPGRFCTVTDIVTNSSGALLGVALGWTLLRLQA